MHVKHHLSHFLKNIVLPFNHAILLRSCWKFMFNPLKVINIINIHIIKLSPPISPNPNNVMPFLYLNPNEKSQVLNSFRFLSQKGYKRISRKIINNHKDIFFSTFAFNSHRTHGVHVKKIQRSKHIIPLNFLMRHSNLLTLHTLTIKGIGLIT